MHRRTFVWIDDPKTAEPLWPDLQDVHVRISAVRPDGGWFLDSYPGVPLDGPIRANDIRLESSDSDSDDSDVDSEASHSPPDKYHAHRGDLQTSDAYYCSFRSEPTEQFERLLVAASRAATKMPKLRAMSVTMSVASYPRTKDTQTEFSLTYEAKGTLHQREDVPSPCSELMWCVPSDWKMNESLEKLWRTVIGSEGEFAYYRW